MADWWGFSRSNYFRVKDRELFMTWAEEIDDLEILHAKDGVVAITGQFYGGWPHVRGDNYEDFDLVEELAQHLADGEIAVLVEAGAEKLRYITGEAIAVNSKGERVALSLGHIYELAEQAFGQRPSEAAY